MKCIKCGWQGNFDEVLNGCCPLCFQKIEGFGIIKVDLKGFF